MDGIFECIVARKTPVYALPAKIGMSLFLTITILAAIIINPIIFVVTLGFGVFMYFMMPRFELEWEYTFLDGELRIDKIFSQSSRKRFLVLLFDRVDAIAPLDHDDIKRNLNNPGFTKVDCSSQTGDSNKVYGILYSDEKSRKVILFEPDDKMLKALRRYSPRKVTVAQ
ncbi:MAG: hypothetical protein IKX10_04330 [Lachnospiraceae bacterium]|nr:hypothetical protein [Lachnospiraceae bacterium]